jgi:hypothetical protein
MLILCVILLNVELFLYFVSFFFCSINKMKPSPQIETYNYILHLNIKMSDVMFRNIELVFCPDIYHLTDIVHHDYFF